MLVFQATSPDDTFNFGKRLAPLLEDGDVICLSGDLGAGKTLLAQGIVAGLGIDEMVTSPTFTVLQVYQGTIPVYHYDLYRLNRPEELLDIGFEDYIGSGSITLIEWPDKFPSYMPDSLWITLTAQAGNAREITFEPHGPRYEKLCKEWIQCQS